MRKLKYALAILLAIVILVACALLPGTVASIQDNLMNRKVNYREMDSVQLNFTEEKRFISLLGKLALLQTGEIYRIRPQEATLTEEEIKTLLSLELRLYLDSGLIPCNFEDFQVTLTPALACSTTDPEQYAVVWWVSMAVVEEPYDHVDLLLDDQTGVILYINYEAGYPLFSREELSDRMDTFASVYFHALGLIPFSQEELYLNGEPLGCRFLFEDGQYDVIIDCYVTPQGFYTEFVVSESGKAEKGS